MTVTELLANHITPKLEILGSADSEDYHLGIGWSGYTVEVEIPQQTFLDAVHNKGMARDMLKRIAETAVVALAKAITEGQPDTPEAAEH